VSTHHIDCAAQLSLPPSKKLVMLCFADGADKQTRRVMPGLENVMQWSGLKKSRALGVIAELVTDELLRRVVSGQTGRMAEFVIFPNGCCALHGPIDVAAVAPAGPSHKGPTRRTLASEGSEEGSEEGSDKGSDSYRTPSVSSVSSVSGPRERGTRLPKDWQATEEMVEFARGLGFSPSEITSIADVFRDYWIAQSGAKGVKLDWFATWRNWTRKEADNPRRVKASRPVGYVETPKTPDWMTGH
jgi:hypothetical protein